MLTIKPKTRKEIYLAYLSGDMSLELPEPLTRDEVNLYNLCKNKAYGEYTTVKEVLAECQPEFVEGEGVFVLMGESDIAVGEKYTVNWNGADYECVAVSAPNNSIALGNMSAMGGDNTGEPFLIAYNIDASAWSFIDMTGSTTLTISIRQEVTEVKQISGKYVEGMGYVESAKTVIAEESELIFVGEQDGIKVFQLPIYDSIFDAFYAAYEADNERIVWDGVEYNPNRSGSGSSQRIGNDSILSESEPDTGEPFVMSFGDGMFLTKSTEATHTVAIYTATETIHPIDQKFLLSGVGATIVTFSPDADGNIVADRTLSELLDAYKNGSVVQGRVAEAPGAYTTLSVGTVTMEDNSDGAPAEMNFYLVRFIVTGLEFIGITYGENNNISFVTKELTA